MALRGPDAFQDFYSQLLGERWSSIYDALARPNLQIQRPNFWHQQASEGIELLASYQMDPASVVVARSLEVQPGARVLDLCAAPGGKSLVLAEALFAMPDADANEAETKEAATGQLFCNEFSQTRRERLTRVLHQYVPRNIRQNIFVKGMDGSRWGLKSPESCDFILVDAPCSGERHLIENKSELNEWSVKRTQKLALRQYSLLASAWQTIVSGGRVVYSTCAMTPIENDEVIAKLLKRQDNVKVLRTLKPHMFVDLGMEEKEFEQTEFGYQVRPDINSHGPMFFSILEKNE